MINQNYQIFNLQEILGRYAMTAGVPLAFIRVTGWNNSTNVDAINTSIARYSKMLESDLIADMKDSEYVVVELEKLDQGVLDYFDDNFPDSQASVANPEMYVFYALYNDLGQLIASNE